jgi:hypothetical protein
MKQFQTGLGLNRSSEHIEVDGPSARRSQRHRTSGVANGCSTVDLRSLIADGLAFSCIREAYRLHRPEMIQLGSAALATSYRGGYGAPTSSAHETAGGISQYIHR